MMDVLFGSGQRVLALTDDQWDLVQFMEMNVFVDDGEGFIDLGLDNVYEYAADGDLCDYYTSDGQYTDTFLLGDPYTATGTWEIENLSIDTGTYQMAYRITDIYGNRFWTPTIRD